MAFKRFLLGDLVEFSQGIQVPVEEQSEVPKPGSVRFVRIIDYTSENQEAPRYVDDPGPRYKVNDTDVVMIRYGSQTAGKVVRGISGVIANNAFKVSPKDCNQLSMDFLYHFLSQPSVYQYFQNSQSSSTMPAITFDMISKIEILVPDLEIQKSISDSLNVLKLKIGNNQSINKTLESMAKVIFKELFFNFGRTNGRISKFNTVFGSSAFDEFETSEFIESEFGPIPKGWQCGSYNDLFIESTTKVGSSSDSFTVLSAVATGQLIRSSDHFNKQVFSEDISKYKIVKKHDFAYNPSRVNIGSIGRNDTEMLGAVSPIYIVISPKTDFHNFNLMHIRMPKTKEHIKMYASGSVRQALSIKDFLSIPVIIPPLNLVRAFNTFFENIEDVRLNLTKESNVIQKTHQLLLPKLLSGELNRKELL